MLISRLSAIAIFSAIAISSLPVRANPQPVLRDKQQTEQAYFLLDRCQPAISERVGGRILVGLDTLQNYFISNAESGLTGQASLDASGNFRQFTFDCRVNVRDGRVTNVTTRFVGDRPESAPSNPNLQGIVAIVDTPNGQSIPLRYGPGIEYFEIESVPNGASVTLSGRSNGDWAQTLGGAWVYRPYLRIVR